MALIGQCLLTMLSKVNLPWNHFTAFFFFFFFFDAGRTRPDRNKIWPFTINCRLSNEICRTWTNQYCQIYSQRVHNKSTQAQCEASHLIERERDISRNIIDNGMISSILKWNQSYFAILRYVMFSDCRWTQCVPHMNKQIYKQNILGIYFWIDFNYSYFPM